MPVGAGLLLMNPGWVAMGVELTLRTALVAMRAAQVK
jgi:hypothetical protein